MVVCILVAMVTCSLITRIRRKCRNSSQSEHLSTLIPVTKQRNTSTNADDERSLPGETDSTYELERLEPHPDTTEWKMNYYETSPVDETDS